VKFSDFKPIAPHWIAGFTDGDGSFSIKITKRINTSFCPLDKKDRQVELRFRITQHIRDAHLLGAIAEYLGCGKVYTRSNKLACLLTRSVGQLQVSNFPDNLNKIMPFFKKYPLRTAKEKDFKDFCTVADYIKDSQHLTPEGLALIIELKSNMNNLR